MVLGSSVMADTRAEQITVLARWQNQRLQIIETSGLAVPPHLAGFYVEWANERGFVQRQHLVEGSTYRVVGRVVRTEVRRFPDGWGARSGKPYSTYHVQARSAKRVKDEK